MQLNSLLAPFTSAQLTASPTISGIQIDSRLVKPGDLFIALQGHQSDGHQYIDAAIAHGAVAVLAELSQPSKTVPVMVIPGLSQKVGNIAAEFYGQPAKVCQILGVTGTNGKTSCTHFFAQALRQPCGVIGTLGSGLYGDLGSAGLTTPDAIHLQAQLRQFIDQGVNTVAMEVSSHSIDQGRVNGIEFELGLFTNLTQDHLDYHGTMEAYAATKRRLFADMPMKHLIINADDEYGRRWIEEFAVAKSVFAYGMAANPRLMAPQVYTEKLTLERQGVSFIVHTPWGKEALSIPLMGEFNVSNVLGVLTALCLHGVPFKDVIHRLGQLKSVPGRMQSVGGEGPWVVVDYAHTPDALDKTLAALKAHTQGKLICVFGCGGDRDAAKRPLMAKAAEKWADQILVTNDNPRHETPEAIAAQIMSGFSDTKRVKVELDRSKAIQNSIQYAKQTDCILLAGKGAERYQQMGDEKIPFDDVDVAKQYLNIHTTSME